jgi:putative Holliday junction resolvase
VTRRAERDYGGGRNADMIVAFDFGLRRIGVATANLRTRTATPLTTLEVGRDAPWERIDALVEDWCPGTLLVGLPEASADKTALIATIRGFIGELGQRYGLPVATVDESFTSSAAADELREGRRSGRLTRRTAKGSVDRYAACQIAEQWMATTPRDQ